MYMLQLLSLLMKSIPTNVILVHVAYMKVYNWNTAIQKCGRNTVQLWKNRDDDRKQLILYNVKYKRTDALSLWH